jgi:hypothetical protein
MITIDDKEYTEEDLNEVQIVQVQRMSALQAELSQLDMRSQELNVLINAYVNSIKESFSEEK